MKILPFWLPSLRLRIILMQKKTRRIKTASPASDPITTPAIAPPDRPLFSLSEGSGVVAPSEGVGVGVLKVIEGVMVGKTTSAHFDSVSEL